MGCRSETKLMSENFLIDSPWCERVKIHNILYIFFFLQVNNLIQWEEKGRLPHLKRKILTRESQ